ncbi:F-box protein SKIP23-like [Silene latifolia]|uniref:F-box protein SKIP23-like n=1 Tax=Silene latifolia TaxID=37657 RepID=UPI003D773B15
MESTNPPWPDLPQELLSTIANFLISNPNNPNPNPLDILTFRSICKSWRSSCSPISSPYILSPLFPLTTSRPLPPAYNRTSATSHSSIGSTLSVTIIYSLSPPIQSTLIPNNFMLFVDEFDSGKLKIRQPFTRGSYSVPAPLFFPVNLNLIDFRVREISRFYNLSYWYFYDDKRNVEIEKPVLRSEDVHKVVLFSDYSAVVALYDGGKLGLFRLDEGIYNVGVYRNSRGRWCVLHSGKHFRFDDIVEYKGRVLGVDRGGRVYEIGQSRSEINLIVRSSCINNFGGGRRKRFVESLGLLYLVVRCKDCVKKDGSLIFKVYQLNEESRKWVEINGIGDRVFFFGREFSFSASAQEVSCGKNCILFKEHSFKSYSGDQVDDNEKFYQLVNNCLDIGVCHLDDATYVGSIESYPGYSYTLWPPPAWLWPIERLQRLWRIDTAIDVILKEMFEKFKTKFSELMLEGGGSLSCDGFQNFVGDGSPDSNNSDNVVEIWGELQNLKMRVNNFKTTEQRLMRWEKTLQDEPSVIMLNQMDRSLLPAQATDLVHDFHTKIESNHGVCSNMMKVLCAEHNAWIFQVEEIAYELIRQFFSSC